MNSNTILKKPHIVDLAVGSKLKERRMYIGMSQEELGNKIGVTFQQIQKYEKGLNRMGASKLFDISLALGIEISYFFLELYNMQPPQDAPSLNSKNSLKLNDKEIINLVKSFSNIREEGIRKNLMVLMKSLEDPLI